MLDVRTLLVFACRNHTGRFAGDPVFEAVTEGRQHGNYSACADLAHWLLFRLGVRLGWVNRNENHGWRVAVNLSKLTAEECGGSNPIACPAVIGEKLEPGDIVVVDVAEPSRSHVLVILTPCSLRPGEIQTAEYGQWSPVAARASAALCNRTLTSSFALGGRHVDSVLHLERVLAVADTSGALVEPESFMSYAQRINARRTLKLVSPAMTGDDVGTCQRAVGARDDYLYGPKTTEAVRAFQRRHGLIDDGKVGPKTWGAIDSLSS